MISLGITWILDGLEVTLMGAVGATLQDSGTLHLSTGEIGLIASFYLFGAVVGSLFFGYLTDMLGRKRLFFATLILYLLGVSLSAISWNLWSFCLFRFITGAGIGGEYSAINSAIDELIPARVRGRVDLMVNGSYWIGAGLGALSTFLFLDPRFFNVDHGWRAGFAVGGIVGLFILFLRKYVPESPRWLMTHGRQDEAEAILDDIEAQVIQASGKGLKAVTGKVQIRSKHQTTFGDFCKTLFGRYRQRSLVGLSLMVSQAFMYNAIFFTYAMVLNKFYEILQQDCGIYLLPFAAGNFFGPLLLGHFFDSWGRRKMIGLCYAISALLLLATGYLFAKDILTARTITILWVVIFFFGSAAASSAYLTVSEIFPLEVRGMAIAIFFAAGTGIGGVIAPWLFGVLIGTGSRFLIFYGYAFAAFLMLSTAFIEFLYGIDAEGKSLEEIASPLALVGES